MGRELAPLGLEPNPLHQPLVLSLQLHQPWSLRQRRDHRARTTPAERGQSIEPQFEWRATDLAKQRCNLVRQRIVNVSDEAQGYVIILGIDPARSRQSAAQHRKRLGDIWGKLKSGENSRHGTSHYIARVSDVVARINYRDSIPLPNP